MCSEKRNLVFRNLLGCLLVLLAANASSARGSWPPVTAEDLAAKPKNGESAAVLNLEVDTNHHAGQERVYARLKIFTDAGKKFGDIEIPYSDGMTVDAIDARTIRTDGSIVPFDGKIYDKLIVKRKWFRIRAKTIVMPAVEPGSIIEVRYRIWGQSSMTWLVQRDLPIRKAKFTLVPDRTRQLSGIAVQMKAPVRQPDGRFVLEVTDVPAFEEEPYMPPDDWVQNQVRFFYLGEDKALPVEEFWKNVAKTRREETELFLRHHREVDAETLALIVASDSTEEKLRKLYARAQKIRHVSAESEKTEKEEKRENLRENKSADDVLKHGYGTATDINRLMIAMARAAGIDAHPAWLGTRDQILFDSKIRDEWQLNANVVVARAGDKEYYLDPATPFCPFNTLSWEQTGVQALEDSGAFVRTPVPDAASSAIVRRMSVRLEGSTLGGTLTVKFTGQEALRRRLELKESDEHARRESLENAAKAWLPPSATVKLRAAGPWQDYEEPLQAEFEIAVPDSAVSTGRRVALSVGLLQASPLTFPSTDRKYPVYFTNRFREADEVAIELPDGMHVGVVPRPRNVMADSIGTFTRSAEKTANTLTLRRRLDVDGIIFWVTDYERVRTFFDAVKAGDEDTILLEPGKE